MPELPAIPDTQKSIGVHAADVQFAYDASGNVAGLTAPGAIASRKTACALGDSITADGFSGGVWTNWGWLAWARRFLADRIDLPGSRVYAVGGKTVAQVRSEQLPQALANRADIAFVHCGTNSLGSVTTDALIADYRAILEGLRSVGTFVVVIPIRAHSGANTLAGDTLLQMVAVNRWLVEYCRGRVGFQLIDVNPSYIDFSTGNVQAQYLRDGLHDNLQSAKMMGKLIADAISPMLPAFDDRMIHLGDVYHATKNPRGNLLTNGLLAGTGGSAVNGATGNVPTGWQVSGTQGAGVTLAVSKEANAAYAGLEKTVLTIGGTSNNNGVAMNQTVNTSVLQAGEIVQAECEIDYAFSTAGFFGISLYTQSANASYVPLGSSWDGFYSSSNGAFAADSGSFILRTEPFVIPAGTSGTTTYITVIPPASGSVSAVVKVGRVSLRKVI